MASKKWNILQSLSRFVFANADPAENESFQFKAETFNIKIAPVLAETEAVRARNEFLAKKVVSLAVKTAYSVPMQGLPLKSGSCQKQTGYFCLQIEFPPDEAKQFFAK